MKNRLTTLVGLLVLALPAAPIAAQVVRGAVAEQVTGALVAGVLVSLERAGAPQAGQPATSVLTDEKGEYALRAPGPGRYRVSAKRIGARRFTSAEFDLGTGETRRIDIALDAVLFTLPTVVVAVNTMCLTHANQAERVASLWEEARTALTATQLSLRDRLFQGRLTRYVRELDPKSLKVLSESRSDMSGTLFKPSTTLTADSLSKVGFWRDMPDGTSVYDAPDADILTSQAFQRDHCFEATDGGRDRRGLVGLAFEPTRARKVGDVRGTLWLDGRTFELRSLEFHYTRLRSADSAHVGGELTFARLPNGAWLVRRWFIRMPQYARYQDAPIGADLRRPMVLLRPTMYRLIEDGGDVFAQGLRLFEKPAVIAGVVLDSTGRPLGGATVRLAGTPFHTLADSAGRFRLDSLPPGTHTVIAEHASYAALGMPVDDQALNLEEGTTERVTLRGANTMDIYARLCEGKSLAKGRTALRVVLRERGTGNALGALDVWVRWRLASDQQSNPEATQYGGVQSRTDVKGVVAFCDLPAGVPVELRLLRPGDARVPLGGAAPRSVQVDEFTLLPNTLSARTVEAQRPE